MARRPDIDAGQMAKADKILSDLVSKFDLLARFDEIPMLRLLPQQLDPIDKKLANINKAVEIMSKKGQRAWKQFTDAIKQNTREQDALKKRMKHLQDLQSKGIVLTKRENAEIKLMDEELVHLRKELNEQLDVRKALSKLSLQEGARFLDWFGGSVAALSFSSVFAGMKLISSAIGKVYDLQERWTHAIGMFRRQIGPATADSRLFEKTAYDLHFPLEEIGMDFEAAHHEIAEFIRGFGFADAAANKWAKQAVELGIATGAGTEAIAELSRNLMLMGVQQTEQKTYFAGMIGAANAAGVSVADFTKELASSKDSLAEFGATGKEMFIGAAGWARRLGVSIKSLQNIVKLTDTFQSTAEAAAKMNTVFGTSINSMDLMLEQDPAKRFNMIRDAMIGAGKNMKTLSRLERKLVSDTLGMSAEEVNAFLDSGKSYEDYTKGKIKADARAAAQTAKMNKLMGEATTTLYNWSMLGERIVGKLQPIFDAFMKGMGLGFESAGKGAHTFAGMVEHVADIIIRALSDKGVLETIEQLGHSFRMVLDQITKKENVESFITGLSTVFNILSSMITKISNLSISPIFKMLTWVMEHAHILAGAWMGAKAGSLFGPWGTLVGALAGGTGAMMAGAGAEADAEDARVAKEKNITVEQARAIRMQKQGDEVSAANALPGMAAGGYTKPYQPIIVGEEGPEMFVPQRGGTVVPNGAGGFLPVTNIIKVHLDSREIQRIPFNTTLPVNVSVVGV